jgi:hypothetical protein
MRQLAIQILLIVGTLAISWRLLMSYGQKALALRRLGLIALAAFAIWSILDPFIWSRLAQAVGVGRGTDLILYGLVVAFFGYMVTTYKRFRDLETRYTRLARRLALDETPPPTSHPALAATPATTATQTAPATAPQPEARVRGSRPETES